MESDPTTPAAEREPTERDAFLRSCLDQYETPLMRYALSLTGDIETARDVVQDTFLRLCTQRPEAVDGHPGPWLFTVCRNRAHDVHRKERRMTPLTEIDLDHRTAPGPSPAESASTHDTVQRIEELLGGLSPNQREVVRLKFQHQLSYQEIAEVTSLSVSNVGFLLHTALKTLRGRLQQLERPNPQTAA
jgi:RNA polymerase sigma-70 factor (ECF subfamily)